MLICNVVGARPNYMKIAPIVHALDRRGLAHFLVHTGQHYDENMSRVLFEELELPKPDVYLGVGSDTHARQTARVMMDFEKVCQDRRPDLVMVAGDVNSTLAAALTAAKLGIPVGHVEAGLRSSDRTMPEELNRIVTDHLSEMLFTTEESGNENLRREGIPDEWIHFVGNCMVDTLLRRREAAVSGAPWKEFELSPGGYALLTLHRPSNVDVKVTLQSLMRAIAAVAARLPVLFPVHPRTRNRMMEWEIAPPDGVQLCDPLSYLTFLGLMAKAQLVLTDSGGIQEETTVLDVPCLTLRRNTERPITITCGTNQLTEPEPQALVRSLERIRAGDWPKNRRPPLWDGRASERVVDVIQNWAASRL
ncbi:MAG TPA: UDP-N-acetylglucosamine 2-epimerase (non-hydrolyzing) [Armatimonadota bacterium]|nr:UDP-N-acetylglucosamine 2-epimerase (non-hydrolyzing) [Armatimonadota bacterium]